MDKIKIEHEALVIGLEQLNENSYLLELEAPELVETAKVGQFVDVETKAFLKRPLGIASIDRTLGRFQVGFHIVGEGTRALTSWQEGEKISVLGPLGEGFKLDGVEKVLVLGGGSGVYPLLFLLEELKRQSIETKAAFGFRSMDQIVLEDRFRDAATELCIAVESLSVEEEDSGRIKGNVMDATKVLLEQEQAISDLSDWTIMTCGPWPMLLAVAGFAHEHQMKCQVSLEERMACGVGFCRTCACKVKTGPEDEDWTYERVCLEGPVFDAERVFF